MAVTTPDRKGRVWDIVGFAAAVLLVVVAFWPVPFGGKSFSTFARATGVEGLAPIEGVATAADSYRLDPGASAWQFEPWVEVNDRTLDRGDLPLWNPYQGAGAPHAANMQSGVFDPLLVPVNLHSSPWFHDLSVLGAYLLGAAAMFAFARRVELDAFEAVVATAAFSLTGWFFLYSNNSFGRAYIYLPVLWFLIELVIASKRLLPVLGLAIAVAASVAIGMPEATFVVLIFSAGYALVRAVQLRERGLGGHLWRLAGGFGLGIALVAPLLLLFLEYLPHSFNAHQAGAAIGGAVEPLRNLLNLGVPFFAGEPLSNSLGTGFSGTRGWLGAGVVALALVGLSGRRQSRRLNAFVYLAFAGFIILKVYDFRILSWVGELPLWERLNHPVFLLPALPFLMALLAGIGVRVIRSGDLVLGRFAFALLAMSGVTFALIINAQNRSFIEATSGTHALKQFGLAAGIAGVVVLAAVVARRWPAVYVVAGLAVIIELLLLAPRGIYTDRTDPFPPTASIAAVQRLVEDEPQARVFGLDGKLFPNTAGAYGLSDIRVLDALYVDRYLEYVQTFLEPTVVDRFVGGPYASAEQVFSRYNGNAMFDLLGVRLLLSGSPLPTSELMRDAVSATEADSGFGLRIINVPGDRRTAILAHPDREFALPAPPADAVALRFSYTIDAAAFNDPLSDGVEFSVVGTTDDGGAVTLWSEEFVPLVDPFTPEWRSAEVSLHWAGQRIRDLRLRTAVRSNPSTDWAAWGDLEYVSSAGEPQRSSQIRLIFTAGGSLIYENPDAYPRAWMVHSVHIVDDVEAALAVFEANGQRDPGGALRVTGLDLKSEAVVEIPEAPDVLSSLGECPGPPTDDRVVIEDYDSDTVVLSVETSCPGVLVLSDVWYPGWRATVNDESVPIYPTDIALRGIPIEAGVSRVVMTYEPASFRFGLLIAAIALLTFLVIALVPIIRKRSSLSPVPSVHSPSPQESVASHLPESPRDPVSSEPPDPE